jgi:hypothetical protein
MDSFLRNENQNHENKIDEINWNSYFVPPKEAFDALSGSTNMSPKDFQPISHDFNSIDSQKCNVSNLEFEVLSDSHNILSKNEVIPFSQNDEITIPSTKHEPTSKTDTMLSQNDKTSDPVTEALNTVLVPKQKSKPKRKNLAVRKDVLNKTVLRIISRYFKKLLSDYFPNFKHYLKTQHDFETLLCTFCNKLFPNETENSHLKYVLGAFVLAPQTKKLPLCSDIKCEVMNVNKCLTGYSHKDLDILFTNESAKTLFYYFNTNGQSYYENELAGK